MKTPCPRCAPPGYHCEVGADLKAVFDERSREYARAVETKNADLIARARISMVTARKMYMAHVNEGWTPPVVK